MIAIPSYSGKEGAVIERMKQEMQNLGYDQVWVDPLGNLLGRIGSGNKVIAIDGHCDTVGVGNPETWKVDPFKGDYRDGVIYGRGACDQKSGLASAIYAGKILKEVGMPDCISVFVVATVLEEDFEGLCWQYIINEGRIVPEAVLITEPTGLEIKIGQRGRMEIEVKTEGISCHGSAPERGKNAIYLIAPVIQEIERLNERLESKSVLGKGTVTVTDIRSTAPSLCAVPDSATIHLDRRLSAGEKLETAVKEVQDLISVKTAKAKISVPEYEIKSYTGLAYPARAYYPMWLMDESDPLIHTAAEAHKKMFGEEADIGVWGFSTNGVVTKGVYDIPTIGFGPGKEEHAHTPDDQVRTDDLLAAMNFYAAFVLEWGEG